MKAQRLAWLVILFGLAGLASAKDKNVLVQTDKFTGKTKVIMKQMGIGTFADKQQAIGIVDLYLAAIEVQGEAKPDALVIYSFASHWQFLDGADVYLLVDGERIDLGHFVSAKGDVTASFGTVVLSETIAADVDRAVLDKIATAHVVEMKIGAYETKLNDKGIERIRAFVAALP